VPNSSPAAPARIGQVITKFTTTKTGMKAKYAASPSSSPKSRTSSGVGSEPVSRRTSRIVPTTAP
jgi:hypothetical protein